MVEMRERIAPSSIHGVISPLLICQRKGCMNTHTLATHSRWLQRLMLCAGLLVTITAHACPGIGDNEPQLPAISRLEIANPQVPAKPHTANAGSEMDMRTLMALQGETIDLVYTLAEPIPSGCVYRLQVSNTPSQNANQIQRNLPWKSLLMPERGGSIQSEPTTGDNTIKFKLVPAPQFDRDTVHTLYASIYGFTNHFITTSRPFKFKNLAYKIINITKEPALDGSGLAVGFKIKAQLNALPKSVNLNSNASSDDFFGWAEQTPASTQTKEATREEKVFQGKYGRLNGKVILLNNTPMVTFVVQRIGDVNVHLAFRALSPSQRPNVETDGMQCQYAYISGDLCSSAKLVQLSAPLR